MFHAYIVKINSISIRYLICEKLFYSVIIFVYFHIIKNSVFVSASKEKRKNCPEVTRKYYEEKKRQSVEESSIV